MAIFRQKSKNAKIASFSKSDEIFDPNLFIGPEILSTIAEKINATPQKYGEKANSYLIRILSISLVYTQVRNMYKTFCEKLFQLKKLKLVFEVDATFFWVFLWLTFSLITRYGYALASKNISMGAAIFNGTRR